MELPRAGAGKRFLGTDLPAMNARFKHKRTQRSQGADLKDERKSHLIRLAGIPEECKNRSRWLSQPAVPPDIDHLLCLPQSGVAQSVIPLRGIGFDDLFRWLSQPAIPPDIDHLLCLPQSGVAQSVIPLRGIGFDDLFRWYRPLRALNHRLGLSQASGLPEPTRSTFAEVSVGVAEVSSFPKPPQQKEEFQCR